MTHFSLKNAFITASLLTLSASFSAFAEPVTADCTKDPIFVANACNVCYTDVQKPTKTSTGWTSELTSAVIPWEHSGIDLQEVIAESTQKLPEIIPSTGVKVTPTTPDQIWEFSTDVVWYEVGSDREFFIEKGDKIGLYTLKSGVKLSMSGKWGKDSVLFKTPLVYEEYNKDLNQSDSGKSRNICVLNTFYTGGSPTVAPAPVTPKPEVTVPKPEVTTPKPTVPVLNAAGPEETEVVPKMTPDQTKTKSGPGVWIFLLLAFMFSSAWTAWKKQKI